MSSKSTRWMSALVATAGLVAATVMADEPPRPRTVSVTGQSEVAAEPDMAHVTLGVDSRKPTMAEARSEVTAAVDRVLALCRDLKIDPNAERGLAVRRGPSNG